MVPNRAHEFKVTGEWLSDEIFHRHMGAEAEDKTADGSKTTVRALELVGGAVVGVLVARKLLQVVGNEGKKDKT